MEYARSPRVRQCLRVHYAHFVLAPLVFVRTVHGVKSKKKAVKNRKESWKKSTNLTLSEEALEIAKALKKYRGISLSSMVEEFLRDEFRKRGIQADGVDSPKQ